MNTEGMGSFVEPCELIDHLAAGACGINALSPTEPFEQVVATIVIEAARALGADRAAVWLERGDAVEVVATTGLRPTTVDRFQRIALRPGVPSEGVLRSDTPIVWFSHDDAQAHFPRVAVSDFGSGLAVPVNLVGDCSGVLFVGWREEQHPIGHTDLTFLEIMAQYCALAVERADLERERRTVVNIAQNGAAISDGLFAVRAAIDGDEAVVEISGAIDICNDSSFDAALRLIASNTGLRSVMVDFAATEFMSVSAARAFAGFCNDLSQKRTAVALRNASPAVTRVLEMYELVF